MEMEALMPRQPGADFGMLAGGVIVNDQMHVLLSRGLPVAAHALADDLAVEDVERGEQSGRAGPLIIMSRRAAAAALHRQPRLGAVERLDLALLIDRQH